ncbi:hypothetical protein NKR19_g99 [Coniochaeta hoffmannii]|uniref:Uncharacterized protein n=1 Tax=Coniochaeta hoffmannii TaxID=91930 RepID=A0AA38SN05_9PEZI|nr:hypothetical protein NKR19_g99 [Coniochaeta hoffmannii]
MDAEAPREMDSTVSCNEYDPENGLLEDHWDCFGAPPYFATLRGDYKDVLAPEQGSQEDTRSLGAGEVYGVLDFCCHRVPAWYRSEVNRIVQLAETKRLAVKDGTTSSEDKHLDAWESSHSAYIDQQTQTPGTRASGPSLIATIKTKPAPKPRSKPTRTQPSRTAKRKAPEPEDPKTRSTAKRRKTAANRGTDGAGGTYHIPKPTFTSALHLSLPASEAIQGKICHHSYRSFRNRLIARVTSKMVCLYARRATEKPKLPHRRCVLQGYETAAPWCAPGERTTEEVQQGELVTRCSPAPEPEMLASPSCANWPPPAKVRSRMAREHVEQNVVEFEGLLFLVDICGDPPVPRVMML